MQGFLHTIFLFCTIVLRDDNRCTGSQTCKETNDQVNDLAG